MTDIFNDRPGDQETNVTVQQHGNYEERTRVSENRAIERRAVVSKITQLLWWLTAAVEALIGLRVLLKLVAANPNNAFTSFIYRFSDIFVLPFKGLTITPSAAGIVLDINSIIAMFVYALLGWFVVRLVWLIFYRPVVRTVTTYQREKD